MRYFASVLTAVLCQSRPIHVQPISTRRSVADQVANRVPPIALPYGSATVANGIAAPVSRAARARSIHARSSSGVRARSVVQRQISGSSPTSRRSSKWSWLKGSRRTWVPRRTTGSRVTPPSRSPAVSAEDDRQSVLAAPDDHDLRVLAHGELFRRLDSLPLEESRADSGRDDPLEVRDPLGFDPLSLRLLRLLLEHELHLLGFLLAPELLLDGVGDDVRKADLPKEHGFRDDPAPAGGLPEELERLLRDSLALRGVEDLRFVGCRDLADRRPDLRMDRDLLVVLPDRPVDVVRLLRVEPVEEGPFEVHDEAFLRRHLGGLLHLLGLDRHLDDAGERDDDLDPRRKNVRGDSPEEVLHPDVAGGDHGDRTADQENDQSDRDHRKSYDATSRRKRRDDFEGLGHGFLLDSRRKLSATPSSGDAPSCSSSLPGTCATRRSGAPRAARAPRSPGRNRRSRRTWTGCSS